MFQFTYSACYSYFVIRIIFIIFLTSNFKISTTTTLNCYGDAKKHSVYCGSGVTMNYPFWRMEEQKQQKYYCGYPGLGIACSPNGKPIITISNQSYYVRKNDDDQHPAEMNIVVPDFVEKACPRPRHNFTTTTNETVIRMPEGESDRYDASDNSFLTFFFNCTSPPSPQILPTTDHLEGYNGSYHLECLDYNDTLRSYGISGYLSNQKSLLSDWNDNYCTESVIVPVYRRQLDQLSDYMQILQSGFKVIWSTPIECQRCESSDGFCSYNEMEKNFTCWCKYKWLLRHDTDGTEYCIRYGPLRNKILIGVFTGVGGLVFLILLFVYRKNQRKRRETIAKNVELFLESYGCPSVQRYKYKDIKKMTNSFKDKLGQGGYGSVFKGKLADGRLVAVKILMNDPKKNTNGEDFMNEVGTIGRTNHVNIVALLGFCSYGSKRALVYEFMLNGSLEKFIYTKKEKSNTTECTDHMTTTTSISTNEEVLHSLGWKKLYQIALGIARGLQYLHRGCNTGRILHFDIKPHNILLDEDFCPKISDFGLAKLCTTRESIVSMLSGGRGTLGYIAPEVYNRNFGGVSYKSDVYSYGMMVLEMVGGRKNIDPFVENKSEIYFPHWIYNHLDKDNDKIKCLLKFEESLDEEMAKKMIMVGLWCIQTYQESRPSMGRVAEMLEGNIKDLQMPPNPFVDSALHHQPPTS